MEILEFLKLVKRKKQTVISVILLFLTLSLLAIAVQPFKYGATSQVLVIQNIGYNGDPYNTSRSNEYLSNLLARVITSSSFFQEVLNSGYNVNADYFGQTQKKQMKNWNQTVEAKAINDSGIIDITVYHPDKMQASQISQAIDQVLYAKNSNYHGYGDKVTVKMIDQPDVSTLPVKPNIILNLSLGLIFGLIFAGLFIYLFPDDKHSFRFWPSRQKRQPRSDDYDESQVKVDWHQINEVLAKKSFSSLSAIENKKPEIKIEPIKAEEKKVINEEIVHENVIKKPHENFESILSRGNINNLK